MADNTTTRSVSLLRVYNREKLFEPCEREQPRFWDDIKEMTGDRPAGTGLRFKVTGYTGHPGGSPGDGGDWATDRPPTEVECVVTSAQIDSPLELTIQYQDQGKGEGSYYGDPEAEGIVRATRELYQYADVLMGCGHGTGRLAKVGTTAVGSTTVVCDDPEFCFQLRRGMPIDFVNSDSGGTVQTTTVITDVDYQTHTITLENSVSVTAGWGIYKAGYYGNPFPNGLRNIVDDGDLASTIFGATRSSNTYLNATVQDGSGGLQDYSEDLVNELLDQITFKQDLVPTELRCNQGIISEYKRTTNNDRWWDGNKGDFQTGQNEGKFSFLYGTSKIPFKVDRNLPARELYAIHKPALRKHTLRKADWVRGDGGGILQLKVAAGGETYAHAHVANIMMNVTISSKKLNCHGKLSNIRDRSAARDT